jgi:hypothetical protein
MGRGGDRGDNGAASKPPAPPTRADIEKQDPILVLIASQHDLALTGSQISSLAGLDATVMDKTRPMMQAIDSLEAVLKPAQDGSDAGDPAVAATVEELLRVFESVRKNYDDAGTSALALLDKSQQPRAKKILDDARQKSIDDQRKCAGRQRSR